MVVSWVRRLWAGVASVALVLVGAVVGAPVAVADVAPVTDGTPSTVSAQGLPTVQINGVVWKQQIVGDRVYVGGSFTSARPAGAPAGTGEVARSYLLAYDLASGALVTSFAPSLNAQVRDMALSPDGSTLYVVGNFTQINGVARNRIAAFDAVTGELLTGFAPYSNAALSAVAVSSSAVYFSGTLTNVNGVARTGVAAVTPLSGELLPFAPSPAGGRVQAMTVSPDGSQVMLGGSFTSMNGSSNPGYGLARFSSDGSMLSLAANTYIRDAGVNSSIMDLETDGTNVYGSGYVYSRTGNVEGTFAVSWQTGEMVWVEDCHGDTYSVAPSGNEVYAASHKHYCGNSGGFPQTTPWTYHRGTATGKVAKGVNTPDIYGYPDHDGESKPELLYWFPDINAGTYTGQSQGPWTVAANEDYVLYGGEFTQVNGVGQQGLVRFARTTVASSTDGPVLAGSAITLSATSIVAGRVSVKWNENNWDRDDETLTYKLYRGSISPVNLVATETVTQPFWALGNGKTGTFADAGLTPGSQVRYRMQVVDSQGNIATSDFLTVQVSSTPEPTEYSDAVMHDNPASYWRLGETAGSQTALDWQGANDGTIRTGVTLGVSGAVGDANTAGTFSGTSSGLVSSKASVTGPQVFSVEAWFKTTTGSGGKIVGFGSASSGTSAKVDRHLYLGSNGRVNFGVYPGSQKVVTSPTSYNDGVWHHVVGTLGADGQKLYVDGALVDEDASVTSARSFTGYWRIGGDSSWSGSSYLKGSIDDVAIYPSVLTPDQVLRHYEVATGAAGANEAPVASFASSVVRTKVSFDATESSDSDGSVVGYAWDFGDGSSGVGAGAVHTYAVSGSYTVVLTVTDDDGATGSVSKVVTVVANQAPVAGFTSSVSSLSVDVDGSGSVDPDGSVVSYAWDFGDGVQSSGVSASHVYGADGTYTVRLTVTDNEGATGVVARSVVVAKAVASVLASDGFGRSVSGGWGTADTGGVWSVLGGASRFSVDGSSGVQQLTAGATASSVLSSVSSSSSDAQVVVSSDKAPNATSFVYLQGRRVASGDAYSALVKISASGLVQLHVSRPGGSVGGVVSGLTYAAGDRLHLRVQVEGVSPTVVRAKVWKDGQPEPVEWMQTMTDSTASLQVPGSVAVSTYLSASATNGPILFRYDDLNATTVVPE